MKKELNNMLEKIKVSNTEDSINAEITEAKSEYLSDAWEQEFENEEEAYEETGRGEAEDQVINNLITANDGSHLSIDDHCALFDAIVEYFNIEGVE